MKVFFKFMYLFTWNFVCLVGQIFPDNLQGNKIRGYFYGFFFKKRGKNLQVSKSVNILYPYNIVVGDDVFIGFSTWLNAQGNIEINDQVMLGPFVSIATGNHTKEIGSNSFRFGKHNLKMVTIEKGAWLAANVSLMPGAFVGAGTVVGAGGVVIGRLDDSALYVGVPVKKRKSF